MAKSQVELKESSAWEINSFGSPASVLELNKKSVIPKITKGTEVLVKIHAASINPIDVIMVGGYGSELMQILRERAKGRYLASIWFSPGKEFPITFGRDFAGVVTQIGKEVTHFQVGQAVYGFVSIGLMGSHAEYVVVDQAWIQPKPEFLSFTEAASIPYVALTTWAVLKNAGGFTNFHGKSFLILGGSGGIGTFAIQYLKSKGAQVTVTCSVSANPLLLGLGADHVVDYKSDEMMSLLESHGPYDCILDGSGYNSGGERTIQFARAGTGQYITLRSPTAYNMESYGVVFGALKSIIELVFANMSSRYQYSVPIKWGFFSPDGVGWKEVADMVKERKIKPVVEKVYSYSDVPGAFEKVKEGHVRGKIVVEIVPSKQ